jgi:hypothetical protein
MQVRLETRSLDETCEKAVWVHFIPGGRAVPAGRSKSKFFRQGRWVGEPTAFHLAQLRETGPVYFPVKAKLMGAVSFPVIVTSWVSLPSVSCHAVIVYFPGGKLLSEKEPSEPVTA